jgi:hypothetical protein
MTVAKRQNRIGTIEHEKRQLEIIKALEPNTTLEKYRPLSDGLVNVAVAAMSCVSALEGRIFVDFQHLYDMVDSLADLVDGGEKDADEENEPQPKQTALAEPKSKIIPQQGAIAVKTTVIGRPDSIEVNGDTVTLRMNYTPRPDSSGGFSLPKGVPAPQEIETPIVAFVGKKQFDKVKNQLNNPEDMLIIEGAVAQIVDGTMMVYANNISSKLLQQAKVAQQKMAAVAQT